MTEWSANNLPDFYGKRVLITGGLGFIGSNIAQVCLDLGAEVTIYDCLDPQTGGNMENTNGFKNDLRIEINDLQNFEAVSSVIVDQDIIFNCAAYTSHPNSMKEPLINIDVNCKGTINLLEAARRFNKRVKIVHVGTSTQIGRMHSDPIDELHPEFPTDIYSANKAASENYMLIYGHAYGMRTTVVRLANVFGPRSNISSSDFGFMNFFIGLALQKKPITVFGDGAQLRMVSYVKDCVAALLMAADSDRTDREVFFAVGDKQYSVAEIAIAITEHIGGDLEFVEWPKERKIIEFGDAIISNTKIRDKLGWKPRVGLEQGLVKTSEYFRPRLGHYLR